VGVAKAKRVVEFSPDRVRDISEAVYRDSLGAKDVASMIKKDGDDGKKLRERASSYDTMTPIIYFPKPFLGV
jgi:hypothetical protein